MQVQARVVLSDVRELAKAAVRTTTHLYSSGNLDQIFDAWRRMIESTGTISIKEVVSDLTNDGTLDRVFEAQGLAKDVRPQIIRVLTQLPGNIMLDNGALALELIPPGMAEPTRVPLQSGYPREPLGLFELLAKGSFHRTVEA
jgi:hypothetical protein